MSRMRFITVRSGAGNPRSTARCGCTWRRLTMPRVCSEVRRHAARVSPTPPDHSRRACSTARAAGRRCRSASGCCSSCSTGRSTSTSASAAGRPAPRRWSPPSGAERMGAHQHHAGPRRAVACAVLTVSDTRTLETDGSGRRIRELLEAAGHRIVGHAIVPDEPPRIRAELSTLLAREDVEAVIVSGGTGLAPRDTTYEVVCGLLEKQLDGFGELFRMLSYQEIGAAAMLSRATAGVVRGRVLASLPGSTAAVELALEKLLVPELAHMVGLA